MDIFEKCYNFTKVEELMQVPGIKEAIYLQIKDLVTVQ